MTEDLRSELLSREEVVWMTDREVSAHSPLASFVGLAEATAVQSPSRRGLSGETWDQVFAVLRQPQSRVRVTVPGATESLVQYFLGGGAEGEGLIGCWLEGDGLRVSYPWSERDVVSLVSQVVFPTPPETAAIDALVLGPDGLAALCASVDAIRSQFFAAMVDRKTDVEYRIDRSTLEDQAAAGSESIDARWLVSMLGLTGFMPPVTSEAIDRGRRGARRIGTPRRCAGRLASGADTPHARRLVEEPAPGDLVRDHTSSTTVACRTTNTGSSSGEMARCACSTGRADRGPACPSRSAPSIRWTTSMT